MTGTTTSARAGPHPGETETAAAAATSHLRDRTAVHGGVGLPMPRGQPGPRAQVPGRGEPRHVPDLGHEHRRPHWANPGDGLDRPIPLVAGEPGGDPPV